VFDAVGIEKDFFSEAELSDEKVSVSKLYIIGLFLMQIVSNTSTKKYH